MSPLAIVLVTAVPGLLAFGDATVYWRRYFAPTRHSGDGEAMWCAIFWATVWPLWILWRVSSCLGGIEEDRPPRAQRKAQARRDRAVLQAEEAEALARQETALGMRDDARA